MKNAYLNGLIRAFADGRPAFACFSPTEPSSARELATAAYDGIVFESEHLPWDGSRLRDSLQYLLDRKTIAASQSIAPAITPLVRIPANGAELNQFFAKQALDLGAYGIVWPHISTVEEAYNAVAACRYPSLKSSPANVPRGARGDGPAAAARYWGLTQQEYYERADVWPMNPKGELVVGLMIEDVVAIENLPDILTNVLGLAFILIGEGDLSQEMGYPRQYDHPEVASAIRRIVDICRSHGVVVGNPHTNVTNIREQLADGYGLLMPEAPRSFEGLDLGRQLIGLADRTDT